MSVSGEVESVEEEMSMELFNGVKVFSATKARERMELGENITEWMRENPRKRIVDKTITQSSDNEFHCLTITMFYKEEEPSVPSRRRRK